MLQYFVIYKPHQVLSQFSVADNKRTLSDFFKVPPDVYPVGRLDYDSEGLLILTNDKSLNNLLLSPANKHNREYWVQVEGIVRAEQLEQLRTGVDINVDGQIYRTKKCVAEILQPEPIVPERNPPIRFRKNIPTSWIRLRITEGKNRQVRRMTAAVGLPTLRLIRFAIEELNIVGFEPGSIREMTKENLFRLLFG